MIHKTPYQIIGMCQSLLSLGTANGCALHHAPCTMHRSSPNCTACMQVPRQRVKRKQSRTEQNQGAWVIPYAPMHMHLCGPARGHSVWNVLQQRGINVMSFGGSTQFCWRAACEPFRFRMEQPDDAEQRERKKEPLTSWQPFDSRTDSFYYLLIIILKDLINRTDKSGGENSQVPQCHAKWLIDLMCHAGMHSSISHARTRAQTPCTVE
jgi:hypothetical protein